MKTRALATGAIALALAGAGGFGLWWLGMTQGMRMASPAQSPSAAAAGPQHAGDIDPATGRKVLYWHDPMVPAQRFDKPGKSPFMDMQLVPVYADEGAAEGGVSIPSQVQQNLGIRTAPAKRGSLAPRVEAVGNVAWNERDVALVQARANGFLEKLNVRATLDPVRKGQALAELYVPDWVAAQEEFLAVRRMGSAVPPALREGAIERMRLAGMQDAQIRLVESTGKVHARLTLFAPIAGVVSELSAREGMTVMAGAPLFRINGIDTVWVNAEVPENAARLVRPGAAVKARSPALPGEILEGKVGAILPEVDRATRTLKARIELANPKHRLVPGMFASVELAPAPLPEAVLVPSEAVIRTGERNVVIVAEKGQDGERRFRPVNVEVGAEAGGETSILRGLDAGTEVVTSGQFLIDSEASLKASAERLSGSSQPADAEHEGHAMNAPSSAAPAKPALHHAEGRIVKAEPGRVTISHGPVPSLQWPPMTMGFQLGKGVAAPKEGATVRFDFAQRPDGAFEIESIAPAASPGNGK